ncbi:MAG: transcriptional regulator [Firmicutes bacterium]|nr:transcriptional regulator [Bacillota bacterium]
MVIFIKIIVNILKRIIFAFLLLYSLNLSIKSFGIIIPINIFNIMVTTILGVPGIVCLVILKLFII